MKISTARHIQPEGQAGLTLLKSMIPTSNYAVITAICLLSNAISSVLAFAINPYAAAQHVEKRSQAAQNPSPEQLFYPTYLTRTTMAKAVESMQEVGMQGPGRDLVFRFGVATISSPFLPFSNQIQPGGRQIFRRIFSVICYERDPQTPGGYKELAWPDMENMNDPFLAIVVERPPTGIWTTYIGFMEWPDALWGHNRAYEILGITNNPVEAADLILNTPVTRRPRDNWQFGVMRSWAVHAAERLRDAGALQPPTLSEPTVKTEEVQYEK
ncbi:MAG: hypothetical protein M1829_004792 [Trizodia sp. TS-e1964]|nr:MAG: hypothetical protein M1829_004792 [Trizodia sp. TS-e1964]